MYTLTVRCNNLSCVHLSSGARALHRQRFLFSTNASGWNFMELICTLSRFVLLPPLFPNGFLSVTCLFSILNKCVVISCCRAGTGGSTHSVSLRLGSWCLKASTKSVSSFGKYVIYICLKTRQCWSAIKAHLKNYVKLLFFI